MDFVGKDYHYMYITVKCLRKYKRGTHNMLKRRFHVSIELQTLLNSRKLVPMISKDFTVALKWFKIIYILCFDH